MHTEFRGARHIMFTMLGKGLVLNNVKVELAQLTMLRTFPVFEIAKVQGTRGSSSCTR